MPSIPSRWLNHSVRHAALLVVQVALALALAGIVLIYTDRHNERFDLSPTQSFVLADQSKKIAAKVTEPIRIYGFYNSQDGGVRRQIEDLLEQFNREAPLIQFRLLDLDRSPALAKRFNIASYNTGVLESGEKLFPLSNLEEGEITNALLKLTGRGQRTLCFLTGHGEHAPRDTSERRGYGEVAKALEKENYAIRTIERLPPNGAPDDCTLVILGGPTHDLFPGEADQLDTYVQRGGRLFVLVDPDSSPSVLALLARFNVKPNPDLIVDERNRQYGSDSFMPRVPIFDEGTFRKGLATAAVFSLARSIDTVDEKRAGVIVALIAMSSPESWARSEGEPIGGAEVRFQPEIDKNGPLPVAVIANVTAAGASATGRVAVFGDSDFASNFYLNLMGNKDLFMSTIAVLAEDEALVAVRRKGMPQGNLSPISLTTDQGHQIFLSAVVVQPGVLLLIGLIVTVRRRRRSGM